MRISDWSSDVCSSDLTVSSGRRGYESPVGRFEILQKRKVHRSNRYENALMPYMPRLNWYGVAFHGGRVPGYPASHGCIRLPMQFAEKLYGVTDLGSFVFVRSDEHTSELQSLMRISYAAFCLKTKQPSYS